MWRVVVSWALHRARVPLAIIRRALSVSKMTRQFVGQIWCLEMPSVLGLFVSSFVDLLPHTFSVRFSVSTSCLVFFL